MTLGEIKVETLRIMNLNMENELKSDAASIKKYTENNNYRSYLLNINGAINRCFSDLETKGVMPTKSILLDKSRGETRSRLTRFTKEQISSDLFELVKITYENSDGDYEGDVEYLREGDSILVEMEDSGEHTKHFYTAIYRPKISRITGEISDDTELSIPENIVCHIPYFLKGELYRQDEPGEAGEARNWYESAMEVIIKSEKEKSNSLKGVVSLYAQG